MGNAGTALGIIGILIGAGAIGFAFFVWNGQNTTNSDLGDLTDELNNLKSDFNNLTDQFDILTELNNVTGLDNFTDALNNLTGAFNNLRGELNNLTRTIVVGMWDTLHENTDYGTHTSALDWLFEFGDNKFNDTDYISVSNTNTRITLLQPGWYRIHISVLLGNIDPSSSYWVRLLKDDNIELFLDRHDTSSADVIPWYSVDSSAFVYSDGTNYIELNGWSNSDAFYSNAGNDFNQLTIEYVVL